MAEVDPAQVWESEQVLAVSQLNRTVAEILEHSLPLYWVRGEVSNFVAAASGHWYFTLKDASAAVRAVMFRGRAAQVSFLPKVGDQVEVRARVSLYEPRGDFQLQVQQLRRAGQGRLFEAFLRLKQQLEQEGLLAAERKRQPVTLPRAVGVITSLRAAALRDVLTSFKRRAPHVRVYLYPAAVQGADAPAQLKAALARAQARQEVDTLLLVRGGGSIEDLWAFNDESLARALANSSIPVICGVGHESDFTIADFVADVRAPTPTAAAELACTARVELLQRVTGEFQALRRAQQRSLDRWLQRLDRASLRLVSPQQRLASQSEHLQRLRQRLQQAQQWRWLQAQQRLQRVALGRASPERRIQSLAQQVAWWRERLQRAVHLQQQAKQQRVRRAQTQLAVLGPQQTLARGYTIVRDEQGEIVRDAAGLRPAQRLRLDFARGAALARVARTVSPPTTPEDRESDPPV